MTNNNTESFAKSAHMDTFTQHGVKRVQSDQSNKAKEEVLDSAEGEQLLSLISLTAASWVAWPFYRVIFEKKKIQALLQLQIILMISLSTAVLNYYDNNTQSMCDWNFYIHNLIAFWRKIILIISLCPPYISLILRC